MVWVAVINLRALKKLSAVCLQGKDNDRQKYVIFLEPTDWDSLSREEYFSAIFVHFDGVLKNLLLA